MNTLEHIQNQWNGYLERPRSNSLILGNLENIALENEFCVFHRTRAFADNR